MYFLKANDPIKGYNNPAIINTVSSIIDNDPHFMLMYLKRKTVRIPYYLLKRLHRNIDRLTMSNDLYKKVNHAAFNKFKSIEEATRRSKELFYLSSASVAIANVDRALYGYKRQSVVCGNTELQRRLDKAVTLIGLLKSSINMRYKYEYKKDIEQDTEIMYEYLDAVNIYKKIAVSFRKSLKDSFQLIL